MSLQKDACLYKTIRFLLSSHMCRLFQNACPNSNAHICLGVYIIKRVSSRKSVGRFRRRSITGATCPHETTIEREEKSDLRRSGERRNRGDDDDDDDDDGPRETPSPEKAPEGGRRHSTHTHTHTHATIKTLGDEGGKLLSWIPAPPQPHLEISNTTTTGRHV